MNETVSCPYCGSVMTLLKNGLGEYCYKCKCGALSPLAADEEEAYKKTATVQNAEIIRMKAQQAQKQIAVDSALQSMNQAIGESKAYKGLIMEIIQMLKNDD